MAAVSKGSVKSINVTASPLLICKISTMGYIQLTRYDFIVRSPLKHKMIEVPQLVEYFIFTVWLKYTAYYIIAVQELVPTVK